MIPSKLRYFSFPIFNYGQYKTVFIWGYTPIPPIKQLGF